MATINQLVRKPRKRKDWEPVIEIYEKYANLREEEKAAVAAQQAEPRPSGTRDAGGAPFVATMSCEWASASRLRAPLPYASAAATTRAS